MDAMTTIFTKLKDKESGLGYLSRLDLAHQRLHRLLPDSFNRPLLSVVGVWGISTSTNPAYTKVVKEIFARYLDRIPSFDTIRSHIRSHRPFPARGGAPNTTALAALTDTPPTVPPRRAGRDQGKDGVCTRVPAPADISGLPTTVPGGLCSVGRGTGHWKFECSHLFPEERRRRALFFVDPQKDKRNAEWNLRGLKPQAKLATTGANPQPDPAGLVTPSASLSHTVADSDPCPIPHDPVAAIARLSGLAFD